MGYTTYFEGAVELDPPLNEEQRDYINAFSGSRRMHRSKGPYYIGSGDFGQDREDDIFDYNSPDPSQPSLWCQWVVSASGAYLEWDGGEKFYCAAEWMEYLIEHFLGDAPLVNGSPLVPDFGTGRKCNGVIFADGEDSDDFWKLVVTDNVVDIKYGMVTYG